ncbi:fimbrial protein [Pseudomonas sp. BIGb0427]|nr:fimbrial protein [Pseudomonas sp. BIGb0427]
MNQSKSQRPLLTLLGSALFACVSNAMAGSCVAVNSQMETLNFGAGLSNQSLTIPADTPNGTVVYQDTVQSWGHIWSCSSSLPYGISLNPQLGTTSGSQSTYPLGKTGLSFRIWMDALNRYEASLQYIAANSSYGFGSGGVRFELIKTGNLNSSVTVGAGYLASLQSGDLILKKFNLLQPIVLNAASCETPSVSVAMGDDYKLSEFLKAGTKPRAIDFSIALNNCQTGIKKVTFSLKANTPVIDGTKGIVALNAGSTAKGIGLQLMNAFGQPLALDTTYPFDAFTTSGLNFKIPLSASYYRLDTEKLQAGSANTEVTFIVSYL